MSIRRLVTRIEDALGPQASPDRVEAIAAAVLAEMSPEACVDGSAASATAPKAESGRALVTAYGTDRPGVLAAVTRAVSDAGANILDVSQKILQDYFTLIMLIDTAPMRPSLKELQDSLQREGERLGVHVRVQHVELFQAMHRP